MPAEFQTEFDYYEIEDGDYLYRLETVESPSRWRGEGFMATHDNLQDIDTFDLTGREMWDLFDDLSSNPDSFSEEVRAHVVYWYERGRRGGGTWFISSSGDIQWIIFEIRRRLMTRRQVHHVRLWVMRRPSACRPSDGWGDEPDTETAAAITFDPCRFLVRGLAEHYMPRRMSQSSAEVLWFARIPHELVVGYMDWTHDVSRQVVNCRSKQSTDRSECRNAPTHLDFNPQLLDVEPWPYALLGSFNSTAQEYFRLIRDAQVECEREATINAAVEQESGVRNEPEYGFEFSPDPVIEDWDDPDRYRAHWGLDWSADGYGRDGAGWDDGAGDACTVDDLTSRLRVSHPARLKLTSSQDMDVASDW